MRSQRWLCWLLLAAGAWMLSSPLLIPTYGEAEPVSIWASHVAGAVLVVLGAISLANSWSWLGWASLTVAGWLIVAPLALGFAGDADKATSNHMLVGMLIGLLALAVLAAHRDEVEPGREEH